MAELVWRRASRCGGGACVEVLWQAATVYVRDTAHRVVAFDEAAWRVFIASLKAQR